MPGDWGNHHRCVPVIGDQQLGARSIRPAPQYSLAFRAVVGKRTEIDQRFALISRTLEAGHLFGPENAGMTRR